MNTKQGRLESPTVWSHRGSIHVSRCGSGLSPRYLCSVDGVIDFTLKAEMKGDHLIFRELFSSVLPDVRVTSHVICRINLLVDENCPGKRQVAMAIENETITKFALTENPENAAFLNLLFDVKIEKGEKLSGNPAYDGHIFLGTTWRWICRPARPVLTCAFTEKQ